MNCKKPLTDKMQARCQKVYKYMYNKHEYCTKEELMFLVEVKNERSIREIISRISMKVPVISTSDNKGYKLALTLNDLEEVEHTWKELDSRIEELERKKQPLIRFREQAMKMQQELRNAKNN